MRLFIDLKVINIVNQNTLVVTKIRISIRQMNPPHLKAAGYHKGATGSNATRSGN